MVILMTEGHFGLESYKWFSTQQNRKSLFKKIEKPKFLEQTFQIPHIIASLSFFFLQFHWLLFRGHEVSWLV